MCRNIEISIAKQYQYHYDAESKTKVVARTTRVYCLASLLHCDVIGFDIVFLTSPSEISGGLGDLFGSWSFFILL